VFGGSASVDPSGALETQVSRVGIGRTLRSPRFDRNQLRVQCIGEPRYYFVLHIEEVVDWFVEALGPQVISSLGVDQLNIHPKQVTAPLH
jgi:hypothetical protein